MIVKTGIDIAEVPRIRQDASSVSGSASLQRIYTPGEIRCCDSGANRVERYAARSPRVIAMKLWVRAGIMATMRRDCEGVRLPGGRPSMLPLGKEESSPQSSGSGM